MKRGQIMDKETIDHLIKEKVAIKNKMGKCNEYLKELREAERSVDNRLIQKMDSEGQLRAANDVASVSIREDLVPETEDWDDVYAHIAATGNWSLLHRRISSAAFKEIIESGEEVPGLKPRILRKINFRSN